MLFLSEFAFKLSFNLLNISLKKLIIPHAFYPIHLIKIIYLFCLKGFKIINPPSLENIKNLNKSQEFFRFVLGIINKKLANLINFSNE